MHFFIFFFTIHPFVFFFSFCILHLLRKGMSQDIVLPDAVLTNMERVQEGEYIETEWNGKELHKRVPSDHRFMFSVANRFATVWPTELNQCCLVCSTGANVQKGRFLESPLHAAAQKDCTEIINVLLEFGANINAKNLELKRPVESAPPNSSAEETLLLHEGKIVLSSHGKISLIPDQFVLYN